MVYWWSRRGKQKQKVCVRGLKKNQPTFWLLHVEFFEQQRKPDTWISNLESGAAHKCYHFSNFTLSTLCQLLESKLVSYSIRAHPTTYYYYKSWNLGRIKIQQPSGIYLKEFIYELFKVVNDLIGTIGGISIQTTEVKFLDRLKTNYCESICQECFH